MTNIAQIDFNEKSIDGVLGTRTRGGRMVGATELWLKFFLLDLFVGYF